MEIKQLKAAAQLAEMHHKADPKNDGKKAEFDNAQKAYELALEAEPIQAEPVAEEPVKAESESKPEVVIETASELSIEELEALLKAKKAEKKDKAETEEKAAEKTTEAVTSTANVEADSVKPEDVKKNENPS
ncbi:hypothetical protein [Spirosoma sp.]|uniref:hypothetical protein n=1 Tax=Spirosoma sp. TaxID=1899569 RepID=UPI00261FBA48|nr:hypothetical protein [Spirosoma sp.]MCX6216554.1 hypothetical protein [Spirosoma sp.]